MRGRVSRPEVDFGGFPDHRLDSAAERLLVEPEQAVEGVSQPV